MNKTADRWAEIDLYWFDRDNLTSCVELLWERMAPLFEGVDGQRGLILNVGWLLDYITEWRGDLNDRITLPKRMNTQHYTELFPNTGTTDERMANWQKRFEHVEFIPVEYEPWTYGDIKRLSEALKAGAARHGIRDLRVGSLVVAWATIYEGEPCQLFQRQPQTFWHTTVNDRWCYNPESLLHADPTPRAAFPEGVTEGLPANDLLAAQWGNLSAAIGLDALVLRDSMLGMGVYGKFGPFRKTAPDDPARLDSMCRAYSDMVRKLKQANPSVWLMGYSNSACTVADWRVNCLDLETLANEGYLDAFIEQTWAGAWNEAGQRKETFWNYPTRGWTAQMAFTLLHAAVLAESRVRHYTLIEGYDAWEPGDVIHVSPERLRWGIWAYLHAGVKMPSGLKFPGGCYISWLNQGKRLLTEEDVHFIASNASEAARDAGKTNEIPGPTLVYCRSAMEWQSAHAPAVSIKEWIDEQAAIVMKSSVPVMSVTRIEYLPKVTSDLFIIQTPVHLRPEEKKVVLELMRSGEPVAIWGSPAGGMDPEIAALAGLISDDPHYGELKYGAKLATSDAGLTRDIPAEFKLYHQLSRNRANRDVDVIYTVENSPALIMNTRDGMMVQVWDPCDYNENVNHYDSPVPPIALITGSPYPFILVARGLRRMLAAKKRLHAESPEVLYPVTVTAWRKNDGRTCLMVCDTEEGFDHSAENRREVTVHLPPDWPASFVEVRTGERMRSISGTLTIYLDRFTDRLYESIS